MYTTTNFHIFSITHANDWFLLNWGMLITKMSVMKLKMPNLVILTCKTHEIRQSFTAQGKGILIFEKQ
jgi:hypothetical protein